MDQKGVPLMMFKASQEQGMNRLAHLEEELAISLEYIHKTADSWFEDTVESVEKRQRVLNRTASLCERLANFDGQDMVSVAEFQETSKSLRAQASELSTVAEEVSNLDYEYEHGGFDDPYSRFSSFNEGTSSDHRTDWDLFLDIEPRIFVAENKGLVSDSEAMRDKAFGLMTDAVSGQNLSRKAKIETTISFLDRVEEERKRVSRRAPKRASRPAPVSDVPDELFFM